MPEAERARNVTKLSKLFAFSSIALTITVVWMIMDDYSREWKDFQRRFYALDYNKTKSELKALETDSFKRQVADLQKQKQAAEAERKQHEKDYTAAKKKFDALDTELYKANQEFQFAKSRYSAARYDYEALAARGNSGVKKAQKNLAEKEQDMAAWDGKLAEVTAKHAAAQNDVNKFLAKIDEIDKSLAKITEKQDRLSKKLEREDPRDPSLLLRNAPLMDFMAPSLKIQQVVVDGVYNDLNFMRVSRVDRCMTCHMAADKKGYEDGKYQHPFKTHPNLDLYADAKSKHPVERFGCTVCHQGRDRATAFIAAAHNPRNAEQEKKWEKRYHWHAFHNWDTPMLPLDYTQSQCYKCHKDEVSIPQADHLNRGRILFERAGCYGCHKVRGFEGLRKTGPDLTHISSKVTPEWMFKWIEDPKRFKPMTRMPKFFHLTNTSSPEDQVRNRAEISALVSFLYKSSSKIDYPRMTASGDKARGKELVNSLGCLACHYVENPATKPPIDDRRLFGPPLEKLGSKTNAAWLLHWLKDPKHYFPETFMPNLRLDDKDAMDITTYLLSLRDEAFEQTPVPPVDQKVLDSLTMDYLKLVHGEAEGRNKLAGMSEEDKRVFLGERLVQRYGCFGCHSIKGFEKAQSIGTELTEEGSKNIHQLDFGFVNIPHTRHDWFYQKLKDPRIFDMMPDTKSLRVKKPDEKLKMPNFQLSDEEIRAIITFVLGLTKEKVSPELTRQLSPKEVAIEEGRRIIKKYNCQGCHVVENTGGAIRDLLPEGFQPPILEGEGELAKSDWLFKFIRRPTTIRPWLKVRMPTFPLTDTEINGLTRYFAYTANSDFPYEDYDYRFSPENLAAGKQIFQKFQCVQCHVVGGKLPPGKDAAQLAPDLAMARDRLRPGGIAHWIADPQKYKPGTRMPMFWPDLQGQSPIPDLLGGDPKRQIAAVRDYVLTFGEGGRGRAAADAQTPKQENGRRARRIARK